MHTDTQSTYLEERILTASPLELVQILYDAAVDHVREARRHLSKEDALARSNDVSKTLEILSELTMALNGQDANEYSAAYSAIYQHLQRRLLEAHTKKSDSILAEVEETLVSMASNWREVKELIISSTSATVASEQEPQLAGRCWNL
jgi:flagellar protein FliS